MDESLPKTLLLFDGVCNLCNAAVTFVIDRDPTERFRFASLQSETGQAVLRRLSRQTEPFKSLILWENGRFYEESTAALRVVAASVGGVAVALWIHHRANTNPGCGL